MELLMMTMDVAVGQPSKPEALGHREYFVMYKHQNTPALADGCRA
jgi:altronate hydrolase